jgi:hypothetical protein
MRLTDRRKHAPLSVDNLDLQPRKFIFGHDLNPGVVRFRDSLVQVWQFKPLAVPPYRVEVNVKKIPRHTVKT